MSTLLTSQSVPDGVSQSTRQRDKGERERRRTSFGECRAILLHELLARGDARSLRAALILARNTSCRPYGPGPIAAQGGVKDGTVALEELEWVAATCRDGCDGCTPTRRNGRLRCDVGRDVLPGEEPNRDPRVVPKHCRSKVYPLAIPKM
jgi:hypothetical protein